jgi:hypothetical protein
VPKTSASPRRELGRTLSRAVKAAAGHRHHRCASRPMTCNGKRMPFPASRGVGIVPRLCSGHLAGAVVQPALGPAASGPAALLMEMRGMMFMAFARVNTLFIIYRFRTPAERGPGGHRPRPEQAQLNPASTAEAEPCCGSVRRHCTGRASRQQGVMNGSSLSAIARLPKPRKPSRCSNLPSHIFCGRIYLLIDK